MDVPNNPDDQNGDSPCVTDLIEITIKTIDSKNYQFQVENDFQIKAFKEKIALTVGIESESQRMIFCGRVLADDKTLKDYKIDNGKVIHVVKRTAPVQRNDSNRDANNQANDANNRSNRRFASYRNEDGSILMGTFSLEPTSNLLNQLMRQLFSVNSRGNSDNPADNSSNTGTESSNSNNPLNANHESTSSNQNVNSLRNRVNQIRRLLGYIETNFQILENPTQFPSQLPSFNISTEQQVLIPEYISLFNDTFTAFDRLRPHLNTYLQSLSNRSSGNEPTGVQTNNSILTRITHHLSHVFHLLTDFNVDPNSANNPISLNVLNANSIGADLLQANSVNPTVSSRIEVSTSGPTLSSTALPRFSAPPVPGMFVAQSPIVFMEIDATISGSRNVMHSVRNLSNFSSPEVNVTMHNPSVASQNNSATTATTNNANSTTNNGTVNASTNQSTPANNASNNNQNIQNEANNNSTNNLNPFSFLSLAFDSFLPCNSAYTVPEIRSAANIGTSINLDSSSLNQQTLQQIISSLGSGLAGGLANSNGNSNNSLFSNLNNLFQNLETPGSQSSDEFEFFDLIRFLINQIGLTNEDSSTSINGQNFADIINNLSSESNANSPRISDYLRSLNLFNTTENQSLIHELLSVVFQNLDFEDLFHLITSDFHEFSRFRQPLQDFIRNHIGSSENIPSAINELVNSNRNNLITIIANITPAQGIDSIQSFQNFINITSANFFHQLLQSSSDENFETDFISALKYLVCSYIQFCKTCFAEPTRATNQLILNYFEQYASYLNPRIRTYLTNTITDRINSFSSNLEISQSVISEVSGYIVHSVSSEPEVMHVETEQDVQSISNDSEAEFADAISDMPSTSTTQKVVNENGEENWQSVVPPDWVPIINEDINRQKNIDPAHQAPFSDAYLNGMPKKRRLEHHKSNGDNDVADPKFRQQK